MCERPANPESASNHDGRRIQTISGRGKQSMYYTDCEINVILLYLYVRLNSEGNVVFWDDLL